MEGQGQRSRSVGKVCALPNALLVVNSSRKSKCRLCYGVQLISSSTAVKGVGFLPPFVCLSNFPNDISKTDAAKITKLDTEMFPETHLFLGSKGQRSRSRVTKKCRRGSLHSCEYCLLLLCKCVSKVSTALHHDTLHWRIHCGASKGRRGL